jgi:hypothetical protein
VEIRQAILKAADHIERYPDDFDFAATKVPDCGTPGCALGWIAAFAGLKERYSEAAVWMGLAAEPLRGGSDRQRVYTFYNRMDDLVGYWHKDPAICAKGMRLYADKYHPAPIRVPDWNAYAYQPLPVAERAGA